MTQAYLTESDIQNYGPELLDMTQRAAMHAVGGQLQALDAQNASLAHELARERRARLDNELERMVPNWREVEADPAWHSYCLGIHTLSGQVRQTHMNEAIARGDARAVIAMFNEFLQQAGQYGEPQYHTRGRAPRARGGVAPAASGILTRQEIKDLYENRRKGRYTEAQWALIEPQIIAMAAAGRVPGALEPRGR